MRTFENEEQAKQWYDENGFSVLWKVVGEIDRNYEEVWEIIEKLSDIHGKKLPGVVDASTEEKRKWFRHVMSDMHKVKLMLRGATDHLNKLLLEGDK